MNSTGAWQEVLLERIFVALLFCTQISELSMLAVAILPFLMEMIPVPSSGRAANHTVGREELPARFGSVI